MPLKTQPIEEPSLNLTPMIDIVFLLIIFFMVGTQFTQLERKHDIQLPTTSTALPMSAAPDEIIVNVSDGQIVVHNEQRTLKELTTLLQEAYDRFPGQQVVIRGEGQGPYQDVIDILGACHEVGIRKISLANRYVPQESP